MTSTYHPDCRIPISEQFGWCSIRYDCTNSELLMSELLYKDINSIDKSHYDLPFIICQKCAQVVFVWKLWRCVFTAPVLLWFFALYHWHWTSVDFKPQPQPCVNCLEICKSVNIVSLMYSLHAKIMILDFDPRVMTFYWLFVTKSYIGVLLLYVVFLTF